MKKLSGSVIAACVAMVAAASWVGPFAGEGSADLVNYELVTVADVGNAPDSTGFGAVGYEYRIGKYEVTVSQYVSFLNAVAAAGDNYYHLLCRGISYAWSAEEGRFVYSAGATANEPVVDITWFKAARFANWMANGQPAGDPSAATTEDGAYSLDGNWSGDAVVKNTINPNTGAAPTYFVPSENEWYKAAYYSPEKGGVGTPGYWVYPTQSDSPPGNEIGGAFNQATFEINGTHSLSSEEASAKASWCTDVGAHWNSGSYYGTFDQAGNVWEWNDYDGAAGYYRRVRGGYADGPVAHGTSGYYATQPAYASDFNYGFRLAASPPVPEIDPAGMGSVISLLAGTLGLVERRRSRAA